MKYRLHAVLLLARRPSFIVAASREDRMKGETRRSGDEFKSAVRDKTDRRTDGQMDVRKGRTIGLTDARTYGKTYEWKD